MQHASEMLERWWDKFAPYLQKSNGPDDHETFTLDVYLTLRLTVPICTVKLGYYVPSREMKKGS